MEVDRKSWRLLPFEEVLWHGRRSSVPRDRFWILVPALLFALALVSLLFSLLLDLSSLPGAPRTLAVASLLAASAVGGILAPRYLFDDASYLLTDRRILWRRGRFVRSMERRKLTYARIRWHRSVPVVGHLELVVAVPFGPLSRRMRIMLHDVREPDRLLALIRGSEASDHAGDRDVSLIDRLEVGESVLWGGHPVGAHLGWREMLTSLTGLALTGVGLLYGHRMASILVNLEGLGLQVRSTEWVLLFSAVAISFVCIVTIGLGLIWHGSVRARRFGRDTEYLLTERRLVIRRGTVELSVDRSQIVDVAAQPAGAGLQHLFLMLDAPQSRAISDSGALGPLLPARDSVPPVLFELRDGERVRELILSAPIAPAIAG
ncbi:MAG: hypothetical protein AAGE52_18095 [Myxococcota bacterium]